MTLIVSLRIPDGIVIAGDSLSTTMQQLHIQGEFEVECPECSHKHTFGPVDVAPVRMPSTTFSYAQKVFPFLDDFGVGTFGRGLLAGKTMHFAIRELEEEIRSAQDPPDTSGVEEVADIIAMRAHELLQQDIDDLSKIPEDRYVVRFQVVGYQDSEAETIAKNIGREINTERWRGLGCTRSGQAKVVDAIWQLYQEHPKDEAAYAVFSLQDAIAYAEFLIGSTASYQQFSRALPTVGGHIDIALLTPFDGFNWIQQKPLTATLEAQNE